MSRIAGNNNCRTQRLFWLEGLEALQSLFYGLDDEVPCEQTTRRVILGVKTEEIIKFLTEYFAVYQKDSQSSEDEVPLSKRDVIAADGRNTDIFCKVLEFHSDNRAPMRGSTMVAKCLDLGIPCTYNRPRHSNDNAHMEASFRLLDTVMRLLFLKALTPYLKQELGLLNTMICITTFTVTAASAISLHQNALMVKVM